MAKKNAENGKMNRGDPRNNKSLAIRQMLKKLPRAKASDIVAGVKKEYGQEVSKNMVYMVKTKANMVSDGRPRRTPGQQSDVPMKTAALWVDAIKTARQLLKSTGSMANAVALLKAIES